jgi:hypothetical protein
MKAVEFNTSIVDGVIKLPEAVNIGAVKNVKVIILYDDSKIEESNDILQQLIDNPIKVDKIVKYSREELHER